MNNPIGVIQGRLLPKYKGRYQAHPLGYWQQEFDIAHKIGLDCIEFILDFNDAVSNPLLSETGIAEISAVCKNSGVIVKTICADYFMQAPLHASDDTVSNKSVQVLKNLIQLSAKLAVTDIVIPCVDQSSLDNSDAVNRFVIQMRKIIPLVEQQRINLSLETDLAPDPFVKLLERLNSERITVNYDIGNSAALGYNLEEELDAYGDKITDIHIKDRLLAGGPVVLGEGNADFELFFNSLKRFDYKGAFIMQAYRDEQGVDVFKKQLEWIKPYLNQFID